MKTKPCLVCGKEFQKTPSNSVRAWKDRKYCSTLCYWRSKKKDRRRTCKQCGKEFEHKFWNKNSYCSRSCSSASQSKPLPVCEVCGELCKKHGRRFCSDSCKKEWYRGENVYNYVGESFRKDAYPVDYSAWQKIAKGIRERDGVCRHCGKTPVENGRALDVHHIIPYRISFDNSPVNLIALCRGCHKKADHAIRTKKV